MKKLIYIILALCLVLTLAACGGGAGAGAGTSNGIKSDHVHCVCVGKAVGVGAHTACSDKDGWLEVGTADELIDAIAASSAAKPAYVVLTADITVDAYLQVEQDQKAFICLGGKKLAAATNAIGELNITDCTGTGSIVGDKSFTIRTYAGAVVNMYAGTLTTTGSKDDTQIITVQGHADEDKQLAEADSTFTLYGGTIKAVGKTTKRGHCVFVGGRGIVEMYNGTICDGYIETTDSSSRYGANVAVTTTTSAFTMYGGEIKNGTALCPGQTDSKGGKAGNVFALKGSLYLLGGTISGGKADGYGGNVSVDGSLNALEIKNCTITGGVCDGQFGGNLYINGSGNNPVIENVTFIDGKAGTVGGNVFINASTTVIIKDCTFTGGKVASPGAATKTSGGICFGGKVASATLKGNLKFENNEQSDIMIRWSTDGQQHTLLSVAELTTTNPIVVASSKRAEFTTDTVANHPFNAVEGMAISEVDGKLVIDVAS